MNDDKDFLKDAVELAGWKINKNGTITSNGGYFGHAYDQEILDALKCNLIEKLREKGYPIYEYPTGFSICNREGEGNSIEIVRCLIDDGENRSLRIIETIVITDLT